MRPAVSVVCPFAGDDAALTATRAGLSAIALRDGDEILIADNRPARGRNVHSAPLERPEMHVPPWLGVVEASGPASSYFARGRAAAVATGEWLVFVDADTRPAPDLLDRYFDPLPADDVAVLAGGIDDVVETDTLVARYIRDRRKLDQQTTLTGARPYAQTANVAIRRAAFEAVGGWPEPIVSGGDADLCWRLVAAGWRMEERPGARVGHVSRNSLRSLLRQLHRHGTGMAWLNERWPGAFPPPAPRDLAGRLRMLGRDRPAYAVLDVLGLYARDLGRLRGNRARSG